MSEKKQQNTEEEKMEKVICETKKKRIKNKTDYVEYMETEEALRDIEDQNRALYNK